MRPVLADCLDADGDAGAIDQDARLAELFGNFGDSGFSAVGAATRRI